MLYARCGLCKTSTVRKRNPKKVVQTLEDQVSLTIAVQIGILSFSVQVCAATLPGAELGGTDITSRRNVVIAVDVASKAPLVCLQRRACTIPATAGVARIDRWTAREQRMSLGRTTVKFQGTQDLR